MHRNFLLRALLTFIHLAICYGAYSQSISEDSAIHQLLKLEGNLKAPGNEQIILVRIAGKSDYLKVTENPPWRDNIETTFSIVKNALGKVIYVSELPTSQSKDWILQMAYHFDDEGRTIVFTKRLSFENDSCVEGTVVGINVNFYDSKFNLIKDFRLFTDLYDNPIPDPNCISHSEWSVEIKKTVKALFKTNKIKI